MKTIIITTLLTSVTALSYSQSAENNVMANAGLSSKSGEQYADGALSEPFVKILMSNSYSISKKSDQSVITITPVRLTEDGEMVEAATPKEAESKMKKVTNSGARVEIYSNPSADFVNIRIDGKHRGSGRILLYNMRGQLVHDTRFSGGFVSVEFSNEPAGSYILHLVDESNVLSGTYKIVKSN